MLCTQASLGVGSIYRVYLAHRSQPVKPHISSDQREIRDAVVAPPCRIVGNDVLFSFDSNLLNVNNLSAEGDIKQQPAKVIPEIQKIYV